MTHVLEFDNRASRQNVYAKLMEEGIKHVSKSTDSRDGKTIYILTIGDKMWVSKVRAMMVPREIKRDSNAELQVEVPGL